MRMISVQRIVLMITWLTVLTACVYSPPAHKDVPATLTNPTHKGQEEAVEKIRHIVSNRGVSLSTTAFVGSSIVILERGQSNHPDAIPARGTRYDMPERFQLLKRGQQCILLHINTDKEYPMRAKCKARVQNNP